MFCQIIESPWYVTAKILLPNACWSRRMFCWLLVSCSDKSDFFPFEKLTETKSFALLSSAKAFLAAYIGEGNALLTAINGMCVLIIGSISFLGFSRSSTCPIRSCARAEAQGAAGAGGGGGGGKLWGSPCHGVWQCPGQLPAGGCQAGLQGAVGQSRSAPQLRAPSWCSQHRAFCPSGIGISAPSQGQETSFLYCHSSE